MLDPVFSVSEFNEMIDSHLAQLGEVTIEGELSEFKISQGKWIYATLKDVGASVGLFGMTFRIRNTRSLEIGMKVRVTGTAGLYQKTGRFSVNAIEIIPSGEGALLAAYAKLRAELEAEGLFDPARKRAIPQFPQRVGLLTALDSQAYQDFVKVTRERIGGVKIIFYPVSVQGKDAAQSVIAGLNYFNQIEEVDLVVITRGGGSLEDLIAFNDEQLVRAIYASRILTVCAIGHEGDVSLAELAADLRASTPSNAAELIFRDRRDVSRAIEGLITSLESSINTNISFLEQSSHHALSTIETFLIRSFADIDNCLGTFERAIIRYQSNLQNTTLIVAQRESSLIQSTVHLYSLFQERLGFLLNQLNTLDPHALLRRGFSILTDTSGRIITSVDQIDLNDHLVSHLSDGKLSSIVVNITKEQDEKSQNVD